MTLVTRDAIPRLVTAEGLVHITCPLPAHAMLTPEIAISYAQRLVEAAAAAEGDRLIAEGRTRSRHRRHELPGSGRP